VYESEDGEGPSHDVEEEGGEEEADEEGEEEEEAEELGDGQAVSVIHCRDDEGRNALHHAAQYGDPCIVTMLMQVGWLVGWMDGPLVNPPFASSSSPMRPPPHDTS
jgi:hypothetical protein